MCISKRKRSSLAHEFVFHVAIHFCVGQNSNWWTLFCLFCFHAKTSILPNPRYHHKDFPHKIFLLHQVTEVHCLFIHQPLFQAPLEVKVDFLNLKDWRPTKAPMSLACPLPKAEAHMVQKHGAVELELQKSHVQKCLLQACQDNDPTCNDVVFSCSPQHVWASKKISKKGGLKLYPCGIVSLLKGTPASEKHYIKAFGKMWLISAMKALVNFEKDEGVLSPFWWVKCAGDHEDHNMAFGEVTIEGCKIPVLQNIGPIQAHECLLIENPKDIAKKKRKADKPDTAK